MAEFVHTMMNWRRMCETLILEYDGVGYKACEDCPLNSNPICATETKDLNVFDIMNAEKSIMKWAAEHPEPVYPTWGEWLHDNRIILDARQHDETEHWILGIEAMKPIPADIAEKLGIEPKEGA